MRKNTFFWKKIKPTFSPTFADGVDAPPPVCGHVCEKFVFIKAFPTWTLHDELEKSLI